ncbi:hypothetical protein Pmi06nite_07230 [Planotetraspora mira]|uniref:Uncharacterized protein n=1 Tax=Planotetraspora mira TaxID=58121 RepID=A0A8J3TKC8_9ACTN|nr:hypothetical protein Pmi06nite_07230 [Planotetraspora mira]
MFEPYDTNFTAYVSDGTTWIRDPRTAEPWHSLTSVKNYPAGVIGVSLTEAAAPFNTLLVTVLTSTSTLAQSACTLTAPPPPPGSAWGPAFCSAFVQITPPAS